MGADFSSLIPAIRRARAYRLYDHRGRRFLDLWQNAGRSLLGHRSFRLSHHLKNVVSQGLVADLPSPHAGRLQRALMAMLPGFGAMRIVASLPAALQMASVFLGRRVSDEEIRDPALEASGAADVAFWRPLLPVPQARVLLPVLPFAMAGAPIAVLFSGQPPPELPESQVLSPVLLAGTVRCLYDLARYRKPDWLTEGLFQGIRGWSLREIYLRAECVPERYEGVFRAFLERGLVLNPRYPGPSILPAEASEGELAKMIQLFREIPGE